MKLDLIEVLNCNKLKSPALGYILPVKGEGEMIHFEEYRNYTYSNHSSHSNQLYLSNKKHSDHLILKKNVPQVPFNDYVDTVLTV